MMDEDIFLNEQIGSALKSLRKKRGYSRAQIAEHLDISYQQVHKYETGVNRLSVAHLFKIQQLLGISANDFFLECKIKESTATEDYETHMLDRLMKLNDAMLRAKVFKVVETLLN